MYYAIHVTAQFATIDDFGSITDGTGFFQDGVTDDAFLLLAAISGESVVAVTSDNNVESIYQTGTLQFHASVGALGEQAADQSVTWSVTGSTSADTTIDSTGLLTVGPDEAIDGTLIITATSTGEAPYTGQSGTTQVSVRQATVYEIAPGTTATVSIDGIEWYVLVKDTTDNKALLWSKEPTETRTFGSSNTWRDSALRTYLNGDWLNGTTVLQSKALLTDITTRNQYNGFHLDHHLRQSVLALRGGFVRDIQQDCNGRHPGLYLRRQCHCTGCEYEEIDGCARFAWLRSPCTLVRQCC